MLLAGPIILMGSVLERIIDTREAVMKDGTQREIRGAGRTDRGRGRQARKGEAPSFVPSSYVSSFPRALNCCPHRHERSRIVEDGHPSKSPPLPHSCSCSSLSAPDEAVVLLNLAS